MTLVERMIKTQKAELKKAHNERFIQNGCEYRLIYEGGLAETFAIMGRREGARNFDYIEGFSAYKLFNKDQVVAYAKNLISQKLND